MTSFYDEKDLEEELSRVNCPDEDLEFEYLFEYEPPCSDFAGGDQGLFEATTADSSASLGYLQAQNEYMARELYSCEWKREKQEVKLTGFTMKVRTCSSHVRGNVNRRRLFSAVSGCFSRKSSQSVI